MVMRWRLPLAHCPATFLSEKFPSTSTSNRLLELAWEAYNDPIGFENPNNYHFGEADFARVGFELVRHIHNVEHDTHCFILKDVPRGVRIFRIY